MLAALTQILRIQELDVQLIRLMRLKRSRRSEEQHLADLHQELHEQIKLKELEIHELKRSGAALEYRIQEALDRIKKLEAQQLTLKKVDDFNACTHEINMVERERQSLDTQLNELMEKSSVEEEILDKIRESLSASDANSQAIRAEICESIQLINAEGRELLAQRAAMAQEAPQDLLVIYEKLLRNKKDRVIVPVEQRACSGCHIVLTPQQEKLVRQGDRLVFCEHCGRVLYWPEAEQVVDAGAATAKRRRRRATTAPMGS